MGTENRSVGRSTNAIRRSLFTDCVSPSIIGAVSPTSEGVINVFLKRDDFNFVEQKLNLYDFVSLQRYYFNAEPRFFDNGTYISPIGFNSTSVTRPLLSRGIDTGDEVVLIRPDVEDDSRALEAITDVERLLQEIEPDVSVSTERIPHTDFERAILQCSDIIRAAGEQRIVTLGGGARDVLLPFVMATITHVRLIDTALFFSDVDGTVREWELPRLTSTLGETTQSTLTALNREGGSSSIPTLTEVTGFSKSTVTRHVNQLTDERLVEVWSEGKTKHARITLTGRLLLRDAS